MKPSLAYPVSPILVNQQFGSNAAYYMSHFGQQGHPGIDFAASHGQPVYAAHDGDAIYLKDAHGGEGIWLYAPGYISIYWHLIGNTDPTYPLPIPFDSKGVRTPVKKGDLIGFADNTGAPYESSGDHLHFGLMLTDENGIVLNQDNGTQGCVNPQSYFNREFAHPDPIALAAQDTAEVSRDIANLKPGDPNAPKEETLIGEAIEDIKEML